MNCTHTVCKLQLCRKLHASTLQTLPVLCVLRWCEMASPVLAHPLNDIHIIRVTAAIHTFVSSLAGFEWVYAQTPLIRFVVDLLYNKFYNKSTTNPQQIE